MNKVFRFKPQKRLSLLNPGRKTKGQLTLFFGICMGIGKTHLMLQEGIHLIKDGFDVVLANYNSHGNKEITVSGTNRANPTKKERRNKSRLYNQTRSSNCSDR